MSQQSVLTNSALECKNSTITLVKQSFTNDQITFTGASGNKIALKNAAEPTVDSDVATKNYVDSQVSGMGLSISWKNAVKVRTTADLDATLSGGTLTANANGALTIDGVAMSVGDRVLVMDQVKPSDNGIYEVGAAGDASTPFHLNRTGDADSADDLRRAAVFVESGTHAAKGYVQTSTSVETLGTDDIVFTTFATVNELAADDGLELSGKHIKVKANRGLNIISDHVAIADKGVEQAYINDAAVGQLQIEDGACISSKIPAGAIDNANKFAASVVNNAALATDAVGEVQVQSGAIIERHILDANVTRAKVANDAINGDKLAADAVQNEHVENGAITSLKIGSAEIKAINIGSGEVQNAAIGALAVTAEKIASNAITSNKVLAGNITTEKLNQTIGSEAVTEACLRDNSCTNAKLAANSVQEAQIADDQITGAHLKDDIIVDRHIGVLNSLSVNGPVTASSFIAGASSAGTSSFSLAKAASLKVSFDNAFTITNDYQQVPTSAAKLSFTYNDNIMAAYPTWVTMFQTDGTVNSIETRLIARYYKNDGSETIEDESEAQEIDHFEFTTHLNDTFYPEGSQSLAVKRSDPLGGEDFRLASIHLEVRKGSSGTVSIPVNADLNIISLVVAEDSAATTLTF